MKRALAILVLASGCAGGGHPDPLTDPGRWGGEPRPEGSGDVMLPGRTGQEPAKGLTLDQAVDLAWKRHPEIAVALALAEAAEGRALQAGLLPNPEALLRMESARTEGGVTDKAEFLAGVSQPLALGGRLGAARRLEELDRDRLLREVEAKKLEIRVRVHGAFATALYLEEVRKAQENTVRAGEAAVRVAQARLAGGDAIPEEVARAEMELSRTRVDLERAESLRAVALATLAWEVGDPGFRIESVEGRLEFALEIPTLEAISARLSEHPVVAAAEAEIAREKARIELAEAERIPDVNLDLFYRRLEASEENSFDVGIRVDLPIFDRNQGRIREARALTRAAEERARGTRNSVLRDLREAHAQLTRSLGAARRLREEILPRADRVLKTWEARYSGGDASLGEVLPIRRDRAGVQMGYLESLREVMVSWAKLAPFLGEKR